MGVVEYVLLELGRESFVFLRFDDLGLARSRKRGCLFCGSVEVLKDWYRRIALEGRKEDSENGSKSAEITASPAVMTSSRKGGSSKGDDSGPAVTTFSQKEGSSKGGDPNLPDGYKSA